MAEIIEIGTMSSRGQVAIPSTIRDEMGLKEGTRILFLLAEDSLIIKRVNAKTFAEITLPLKEAIKKTNLKERDVLNIIKKIRN